MGKAERKSEFPKFDGRLRDTVTDDMAAYVGEVMSSVAFRGGRKGVHSVKSDTKGVRGKNGDEAHSRQLRVMNFFEHGAGSAA